MKPARLSYHPYDNLLLEVLGKIASSGTELFCQSSSRTPEPIVVPNLGRNVNAGQKGIRILALIVGADRKKAAEANKDVTKQNERVLLGFHNAYVFDISQTDGVDLPEMCEVSGDPGENLERLASFVRSRGIQACL